jgi:hypothetical protein
MKSAFLTLLLSACGLSQLAAQNSFFNIDSIQEIKLTFFQSNWDAKLDSLKGVDESAFLLAASVEVNGVLFDSVGVKYKGNSSYNANNQKNPMHISLNYVHGKADYKGYTDIKLGNGFADPSFVREPLSYELLRNYMDAPRANFAKVWIDGVYWGVYSHQESIDQTFARKHFYSTGRNPMIKCNPLSIGGPGGMSNNLPTLVYAGADSTIAAYNTAYEVKSDWGWTPLIALMDTLKNHPQSVEKALDVDRALWMLAFNDVFVNLDSYTGAFGQNYYLYLDDNNRWIPIVWDLNMSFGGFNNLNSGGGPGGGLSIAQMQSLDPLTQSANASRPLIQKLLANPLYKRQYLAHLRTMAQENFSDQGYADRAIQMQNIIDAAVLADNKKFFTYQNFHDNVHTTISGGGGPGGNAPGLTALMDARYTFLSNNANLTPVHPTIAGVTPSTSTPLPGQQIWVTATVTDATLVTLAYRAQTKDVFQKTPMFDDGLHHDGAAGDHVYGGSFTADLVQNEYYLYAENANAGQFSPERAEYEFYTIHTDLPVPPAGTVVINEFLADNKNGETDEAGQHDDWVELYNKSADAYDLKGLYLTDKASTPDKWTFPQGSVIAPHGYLIVWLDNDLSQGLEHANFKLSNSGEFIMLSDGAGVVYDSITFGPQLTDISYGRYPNGTGNFTYMPTTFDAMNSLTSGTVLVNNANVVRIFPNPAGDVLHVRSEKALGMIRLFNALGQVVSSVEAGASEAAELPLDRYPAGLYFIQTGTSEARSLLIRR